MKPEPDGTWRDHLVLGQSLTGDGKGTWTEKSDEELLLQNIEQYLDPQNRHNQFSTGGNFPFDFVWKPHQRNTLDAIIGYLKEKSQGPVHRPRRIQT